ISVFEADMARIRDHILFTNKHSLGEIAEATGIPKSTIQKMLSPKGIRRKYNLEQLKGMKERNIKRYIRILMEHTGVVKDRAGRWMGLEYRESDRKRFEAWLKEQGYVLIDIRNNVGGLRYMIVQKPEDVKEEIWTSYTHRIMS
ncbi:MAG: hypothetical protein ACE5NG_12220, partial [bacterium]